MYAGCLACEGAGAAGGGNAERAARVGDGVGRGASLGLLGAEGFMLALGAAAGAAGPEFAGASGGEGLCVGDGKAVSVRVWTGMGVATIAGFRLSPANAAGSAGTVALGAAGLFEGADGLGDEGDCCAGV